jgi:hypothetical protein
MLDTATRPPDSNPPQVSREAPRRLDPGTMGGLEPFLNSPLLASGQINLLSLDPIAERLGARWPARRDPIYDYVERALERHIGARGHIQRVSETDFLVVLPDEGKFTAQARCLRALREVLTYFLGEARPADLTVREVSRITPEGLEAVLVDPVAVIAAADIEEAQRAASKASARTMDRWTPFVASDGRKVRVSCVLEPVFELKHHTRIGYRIARRVLRTDTEEALTASEIQNLSRADIERIDLATIARGLDRLRTDAGHERQLSLIVPVSYTSLSNRGGRAALAALFGEAKALVRAGVICEICDIEGVPQVGLTEAISLIKPYCMFAIGHLRAAADHGLDSLRDAGLHAVSFEAPPGLVDDAEFLGWAKGAITAAKRIAKSVIIYRLDAPRHAGIVGLLGASHASLRSGVRVAAEV